MSINQPRVPLLDSPPVKKKFILRTVFPQAETLSLPWVQILKLHCNDAECGPPLCCVAYASEVPDELVVRSAAGGRDVELVARVNARHVESLVLEDDVAQLELRLSGDHRGSHSELVVGVGVPRSGHVQLDQQRLLDSRVHRRVDGEIRRLNL